MVGVMDLYSKILVDADEGDESDESPQVMIIV